MFGPPAVGKMTVARAVCATSDFRLFHNHHTIEPLHETFGQQSLRLSTTDLSASEAAARVHAMQPRDDSGATRQ